MNDWSQSIEFDKLNCIQCINVCNLISIVDTIIVIVSSTIIEYAILIISGMNIYYTVSSVVYDMISDQPR